MIEAPDRLVGPYARSSVDWIEANVVTESMVDAAIRWAHPSIHSHAGKKWSVEAMMANPFRRAQARRNIAIGIRAGTYWPYFRV